MKRRTPTLGTILGATALVISITNAVIPAGAGGQLTDTFPVKGSRIECGGVSSDACGYLTTGSVETNHVAPNTLIAADISTNGVGTLEVQGNSLTPSDILRVGLQEVRNAYPGFTASETVTDIPSGGNVYFGRSGAAPANASFFNYTEFETQWTQTWEPCASPADEPPQFPCLKVPTTGTYQLTMNGLWEENTVGNRQLELFYSPGPACSIADVGPDSRLLGSFQPAASLPTNDGAASGRVQIASGLVSVEAGDCVFGHAFNGDSATALDLTLDVSMILQ
jgi:hypothetical protein